MERKMKIEWGEDDISAGRIVGKPERTERWMIGYVNGGASPKQYALVSLSDGCIQAPTTAAGMAQVLNTCGEMPLEFFADPGHVKRGQKGARARADNLSPVRRSEIAATAANARWAK